MGLSRRRWRQLLGALAILLIALGIALRSERAGEAVCQQLRERLPGLLNAKVELERCAIDPLTGSVRISGVSVWPEGAAAPLATADEASVALRGLFLGGVALQQVSLVRPQITVTVPATSAPTPKRTTCLLEPLSRLRVGQLEVQNGAVTVNLPEGRVVKLDGLSIDASLGRREATLQVDARGGAVALGGERPTLRIGRISLEGSIDLLAERAEVQRADLNVEGVRVTASGLVDALCDADAPTLDLAVQTWVPLETLPRLGVALPQPSGQLLAHVQVTGRATQPRAQGEVQGSQLVIGGFTPGDFSARATFAGRTLTIDEFFTRVGDSGEVRVSGALELTGNLPLTARVETKDASLARALARAGIRGAWVDFPASVKGVVTGTLKPLDLGGDIDFRTGPFVLANRAYDAPATQGIDILRFKQAGGRFHLGVNREGVSFGNADVRVGVNEATRLTADVKLWFDPARGVVDVNAVANALDLSDFGAIAGLPFSGVGTAPRVQVAVKGNQVEVEAALSMRDMKFAHYSLGVVQTPVRYSGQTLSFPALAAQKGQTQYFGDVALTFGDELHVTGGAQLPDGRVEDVVDLLADLSSTMENLQDGVLTGRLGAVLTVDCPVSRLEGTIAANLRDVRYLERHLGGGGVIARFENGEGIRVEPTQLTGALGQTSVDGMWKFAGPLDFRARVDDGSMAELFDPGGVSKTPVGGTFTANAIIGGTTDLMLVDALMHSGGVEWKAHDLGELQLTAHVEGRALEASGQLFNGLTGAITMTMRDQWPFEASLDAELHDLSPFLPASASMVAGRLRGTATLRGPMRAYERSKGEAVLTEVALSRGEVALANVGAVELGYDDGAVLVKALKLRGATSELEAQGSWGPTRVDLKSRGSLDLRLASSFVSQLERAQGLIDFSAAFSGAVERPSLAGSATISDARFSWAGYDVNFRALSGRADFSESRVLVQDLHGFLNEGRVRARGDLRLDGLHIKSAEVQTDIEDATIQVQPDVPATFTGSLLLTTKDAEKFQLQGGLDVVKFRYTQPMSLETLVANAAQSSSVPDDTQPNEWLKLDVDLRTAGDVRIENDLARAKLTGKLRLTGTNVKPVLIGTVETLDGAQAVFRGHTFSIQRGLLQFNGLWPTFELDARSQVRDYLIGVKAFGRIQDPKVSFSSDPALPDADILALLTLGVTSRERLDASAGAGLAAEALMTASGLDQQVQRFLQENVGLKDQQVKLTTSFNESTGSAEPAVTWETKVINDNLKVGVVQPVTGKGTKAQIEYRIDKNVSARAQWDNQNQNTTVGNPGVELRFRFEWE